MHCLQYKCNIYNPYIYICRAGELRGTGAHYTYDPLGNIGDYTSRMGWLQAPDGYNWMFLTSF